MTTTTHPPAQLALRHLLAKRLSDHAELLALSLPSPIACAEVCGDPLILGGVNSQDFVLFRDPDKLEQGVLQFEFYHPDCAINAYGAAAIPR